jgi:hypothetical protein
MFLELQRPEELLLVELVEARIRELKCASMRAKAMPSRLSASNC